MKRIYALILSLTIAMMMCSCGAPAENIPEPTPEPPHQEEIIVDTGEYEIDDSEVIKVKIIIEGITIRKTAGEDGEAVGETKLGDVYPVLDMTDVNEITWYNIDTDMWIPSVEGMAVVAEVIVDD